MAKPAIHNKAPDEKYPIGKVYKEPDLDESEKITTVTCVITPNGDADDLVTYGSVSIASDGKSFSWGVEKGRSGIDYEVQFKVVTDGGKTFEFPDLTKEKALVRVI